MYRSITNLVLLTAVCSLLFGGIAFAARQAGTLNVTPSVGYHVIDGGMDLDDAAVFGLSLGYNVTPTWAVEADARYTPTETDRSNSTDIDIWTFSLGGLYHFKPEAVLIYSSFGAGLMVYDIENTTSDDEDAFGYYGGGIKYALSDSVDFRLDARHLLDYRSDNRGSKHDDTDWRHHFQAMAGLTFQFSGAPAAVKQDTAPAPMVKEEDKTPVDSDGDGVLDFQDKCPGTAPGVRVNVDGCPADTDGDGVFDFKDACIDTPTGTEVDQYGCPMGVKEVASMTLDILFGFDKSQVTPFHYEELKKAAEFIEKYPMYKVVVEGHTDDQGPADYNQALSQRRADSVSKVLIDKYGVPASRIRSTGFGSTQPVTGNATEEERVKNRRVEISIRP